ncbi:MAG: FAD:protein FMN transferase [Bacteroidaceae bacterium]|nr:FAD:protein FMN transferase [Bacteroidaceae bacterium]
MRIELKERTEPRKKQWWHIPLLLFLIAGTIYIIRTNNPDGTPKSGAWPQQEVQRCEGAIFGTFYHITYQYSHDIEDSLVAVMNEVDRSLSPFNKESIITAVNHNKDMEVNEMFSEVFMLAKRVNEQTSGAFDITVAPLVNAWGFGFQHKEDISDALIDSLMETVGMEKVNLEGNKVVKTDPRVMLDCSAIAKGYGVDAVGRELERLGVKNYLVEIGGELRMRGINPSGATWRVGINKPIEDLSGETNEIEQVVELSNQSMATSGNYRNYYEEGGKKYAHTIDPKTGQPVQHSILSSTVIANDCATADAYATAFMVLGLDSARQVLNHHPELSAYFIYTDSIGNYATWNSDKMAKNLVE